LGWKGNEKIEITEIFNTEEKREDTEITNISFDRIYSIATDYTAAIFIFVQ